MPEPARDTPSIPLEGLTAEQIKDHFVGRKPWDGGCDIGITKAGPDGKSGLMIRGYWPHRRDEDSVLTGRAVLVTPGRCGWLSLWCAPLETDDVDDVVETIADIEDLILWARCSS